MTLQLSRLALTATVFLMAPPALAVATDPLAEVNRLAGRKVEAGPRVKVETTKGVFEIVTFPKAAPKTVANFLELTRKGFYDGTKFHRVIPGFVAQGGDPFSKRLPAGHPKIGTGGSGKNIPDEHGNGLKHLAGAVAMAHSAMPNSASSQFYVAYDHLPHLDGGYTVFGQVVKGLGVVEKLAPTQADAAPIDNAKPDTIVKMTVLD